MQPVYLSIGSDLNFQNIRRGYYITMFALWGLGVDLPRLITRYGKAYSQVIDIHSISMVIIGLLTILYVFAYTILYYNRSSSVFTTNDLQLAQIVLSWILVFFILVQFILGYITRAQMVKISLSTTLFTIKSVHKIIGNLMIIFGKTIIILLLVDYDNQIQKTNPNQDGLLKAWLLVLGALILIQIIMEVIYRSQTRTIIFEYPHKHKNKHEKYHKQIFDCLSKGVQVFQDFKHMGVRYLIIDNCMYYIDQNFLHPGGQYIFSMYNGRQINYLIRGTRQIAPEYPRHTHSKFVMKYLENRIIGELPTDSFLINQKVSNQYIEWKIKNMKKQGTDAYLITFQNQAGYIRQLLKIQNFGKYIMMGCPNEQILNKVQRPYTLIISLCETQKRTLDKFKQAYNFYYTGKVQNTALLQKTQLPEVLSSKLTFCIKQYKNGLFTKFLFNSTPGKTYTLTGPYGCGLNLKPTSRGYYIMIGVGSGITPYVDLFTYMLQKTLIDLIAHKVGQTKARRVNNQNMDFSCLNDLRILFIGSFVSSKHFYFHDTIKELYQLNRVHRLSNFLLLYNNQDKFNLMLKYQNNQIQSDVTMIRQSFDRSFFKGLLDNQNPDKIFYCGPSSIEFTMRKIQSEMQLTNKFVYL